MHHDPSDSQSAHKQACLRLFAEILYMWYNFESTTYDTRSRKSCLVFRVCGNYALMRVVHCGVLAARASPIHMDRTCGGKLLTHFVFRSKSYARVITEKGCIAFSYTLYFA